MSDYSLAAINEILRLTENLDSCPGSESMGADIVADRRLHKFGGSSLASSEHFLRVAETILHHSGPEDLIVVSAAGKTTDKLIAWFDSMHQVDSVPKHVACHLRRFQLDLIHALLDGEEAGRMQRQFEEDFDRIQVLIKDHSARAEVLGYGEVWSARLLSALLKRLNLQSTFIDSRTFLRAEPALQPPIDVSQSLPLIRSVLNGIQGGRVVITGYMASDQHGKTVLLGRNGSDYSATMIGRLAGVAEVVIWSDVAGIYTADPRRVSQAQLLPTISLEEASELARLGASVLHRRALQPVADSLMQVSLRSSFDPGFGITRVKRRTNEDSGFAKSITGTDNVCIIKCNLSPAEDIASALERIRSLLSQANHEPLILKPIHDRQILIAVTREFAAEAHRIAGGEFGEVELHHGFSLVAAVGVNLSDNALVQLAFSEVFEHTHVETIASSNLSLAVVFSDGETTQLLNDLHDQLFQ